MVLCIARLVESAKKIMSRAVLLRLLRPIHFAFGSWAWIVPDLHLDVLLVDLLINHNACTYA